MGYARDVLALNNEGAVAMRPDLSYCIILPCMIPKLVSKGLPRNGLILHNMEEQ